jgi:hypothetical protein
LSSGNGVACHNIKIYLKEVECENVEWINLTQGGHQWRALVNNAIMFGFCIRRGKVKVNLSLFRPWRPLGLRKVEVSTFSGIRLIDGCKVVSPTPATFYPQEDF